MTHGEPVTVSDHRGLRYLIGLILLLAVCLSAATANAAPLTMTFTEDRANVGVQLSDEAMFEAPETAPLDAQIDPGSGSITAGILQVPQFSTHITDPIDADVTVDFEIGVITGSFNQATGALTLEGEAGGTLTSEGKECAVSTDPAVLTLSTAGNSGGASPRNGVPFSRGLTGPGAIAGQWTDMHAAPLTGNIVFCEEVEDRIGGPGGIWMAQEGDIVAPAAPLLTRTYPASPALSGTPRIVGAAEAGSTVRVYSGPDCAGAPVATGSAAELSSPGIAVDVTAAETATFSATATDAAQNASACSAPISYTRVHGDPPPPPPPACTVPKLIGKTLARAKAMLRAAGCSIGNVRKQKRSHGKKHRGWIVRSSNPGAGATPVDGEVDLKVGPRSRKAR